jgi:glycine cleavage system H protein
MPIAGEVIAVNTALDDAPETLNEDPYGNGWLIRIKVKDAAQAKALLSAAAYQKETA